MSKQQSKKKGGKKSPRIGTTKMELVNQIKPKVHQFTMFTSSPGGIGSIANTVSVQESFWEFAFKLTDLSKNAQFTALFDQFRITKVELEAMPTSQLATQTSSAGASRGCYLVSVVDNDDISAPASLDEMRAYGNAKVHLNARVLRRTCKPAVLVQNYETSIATGYTPVFDQWVSTTDAGTQHFGIKIGMYCIDVTQATNAIIYMMSAKYFIECKNSK